MQGKIHILLFELVDWTFSIKIQLLAPVKGTLVQNLIGIEKESLRVSEDGNISQETHPESYGSPLTNPAITTDFSEALIELVTDPFNSADKALNELAKIQHFVHHHLSPSERFWPASMPCYFARAYQYTYCAIWQFKFRHHENGISSWSCKSLWKCNASKLLAFILITHFL